VDTNEDALTLEQIQFLTGHENTDAVRMALRRAGVKSVGVAVALTWPPKKIYSAAQVWNLFSARMIEHSATSDEVKERFWEVYGRLIEAAASYYRAKGLFADRLGG